MTVRQKIVAAAGWGIANEPRIHYGQVRPMPLAILLERGDDPLLCSHGSERGPVAIRYSDECRYQPPVVRWLTSTP